MSEVDDIPIKLRIGEVVNVTCRTQELISDSFLKSYSPYHRLHIIKLYKYYNNDVTMMHIIWTM